MRSLGLALLATACAASSAHTEAPDAVQAHDGDTSSLDATLSEWESVQTPHSAERVVLAAKPTGVQVIGDRALPPARVPGIQRRIDVQFHDAELANVVRMLASAGNFNVVTGEGLTAKVSVDLKQVRPYDALVAIAEANGAVVEQRGDFVLVRGARP